MPLDVKKPVNVCDMCGAPNALLRTFTDENDKIVDALSGYTCQECLSKEEDYVENLADEIDRNPELRDQLTERFQRIRLKRKANFICEYGLGVKHEICEICGQGNSYLCIVEDHFESHVEMRDEIAGWFCIDCITTGIYQTYMNGALRELIMFLEECDDVKARYETYMTTFKYTDKATKQEALSNFESAMKRGIDLEVQESVYKRKAEHMKNARLSYEGTPVKFEIKTAKEGDLCSLCGKTYGKDCKCRDDQKPARKLS